MHSINALESTLKQALGWHKSRAECLVQIMLGLIAVRSVNLKEMAGAIAGTAQIDSHYRRLQRFFSEVSFPPHAIAHLMMELFLPDTPVYLSIDRTHWQWGQSNINILVLSACYRGVAIPLYWVALPKKGNSDTSERTQLIERFIEGFGAGKILGIAGDREFIGDRWFAHLQKRRIPFDMRVKANHVTTNSRGLAVDIDALFYHLKPGEFSALAGRRRLMGRALYLSALRLKDGKLLIIASTNAPKKALERYGLRWQIETLFACLKGRGFRFEATRLTDPVRIEKMMAALALTFAWAHYIGDWRHTQRPIKVKKHGRLAMSYFRCGLDWIRQARLGGESRSEQLVHTVSMLVAAFSRIRVPPPTGLLVS